MVIIEDIIWLERIVEKLAWKHNVLPSEVEEVLSGKCKIFKKEKGMAENNQIKDMSIHEASEYWDEHDFDEFGDVLEVKELQFSFKKKKYIGVDRDLYATIKCKAKALNKSEDTLINEWLSEKASTL